MNNIIKFETNKPYYFFDDELISSQKYLYRRWLSANLYPEPVIEPNCDFESKVLSFGTILHESIRSYKLYYSTFSPGEDHGRLCMAVSNDGLKWDKPNLNLISFNNHLDNNIVLLPDSHFDSPSLIYEQGSEFPYKMVVFEARNFSKRWGDDWGIYAYQSKDGLIWHKLPQKLLRAGDRNTLMFSKPDNKYILYTRSPDYWDDDGIDHVVGGRHICRFESKDFVNWSKPELVLFSDLTDETDVEFYGMSVFERNGWHIGLLEYWKRNVDVIEIHLAISRDGHMWFRPHRNPFIAAQYYWNRAWSNSMTNSPIIINEQMIFYIGGRHVGHTFDSAQQSGVIGYASLPLDHFCAIEAGSNGELTTNVIVWPGGELLLNADTRQSFSSHPLFCDGKIEVEILDENGCKLSEWSGQNKAIFRGNTHCRCKINNGIVIWPAGRKMHILKNKRIVLRFSLQNARLFTIQAND